MMVGLPLLLRSWPWFRFETGRPHALISGAGETEAETAIAHRQRASAPSTAAVIMSVLPIAAGITVTLVPAPAAVRRTENGRAPFCTAISANGSARVRRRPLQSCGSRARQPWRDY